MRRYTGTTTRSALSRTTLLSVVVSLAALAALASGTGVAAAHTGEDATLGHVIIEVGTWALGIALAVGALVAIFWFRARWLERRQA